MCEERRASLARLLNETSDVAAAEADAVFTDERLARQRAHILQRVEQESRQGRLISFPAGHTLVAVAASRPSGRALDCGRRRGRSVHRPAGRSPDARLHRRPRDAVVTDGVARRVVASSAALQAVSTTMSEEEFLGRLEIAIEGTGGSALRPLDDLTPLVWEVAAQ